MRKISSAIFLTLLVFAVQAQKVHLKTGNFSVKHTDIDFQVGYKINVSRVYNSTSNYKSIFGIGWSYDYSKVLVVNPDGSLVTKECECEGRTDNVYSPTTFDETAKTEAIEKIAAAVQSDQPMSPEEAFNYKRKLSDNRGFFIDEWKKLLDKKKIAPYVVATGTKFISKTWGFAVITKTNEGYTLDAGNINKFYSNDGLLLKETNRNDFIQLTYNSNKQLIAVEDHLKNKLQFTYNADGLVRKVVSSGIHNVEAVYTYKGELLMAVKSTYQKTNFTYTYSSDGSNLLVKANDKFKVLYTDETDKKVKTLLVNNDDSSAYEYTKETISDREYKVTGKSTSYYYYDENDEEEEEDEDESDTIKTQPKQPIVWKKNKVKECAYYITSMADGFQYNYRTITSDKGVTEDVYQNEEGDPDIIVKGSDSIFFKYNKFGEIIRKESDKKLEELVYDPSCATILYYKKVDKYYQDTVWRKFEYNANCELAKVENQSGEKVTLGYDDKGKIKTMTDLTANKTLTFSYNALGKPITIDGPEGGITVKYDKFGEIEKVESKAGHKMALQVTQMFQTLLILTKLDNLKPCKCRL
jgi:YD repeat-containing protein